PTIADQIREAGRALAAAQSVAAIRAQPEFTRLELPQFDLEAIDGLLQRDLPQLDAAAAAQMQAHLARIGDIGERWVGEGVGLIDNASEDRAEEICPFCAQSLVGSNLIDHYRAYFGAEYAALKAQLDDATRTLARSHGGDVPAAFERAVRVAGERREFWSRFINVPEFAIDTAEIARIWGLARDSVQRALEAKQAAPLERRMLDAPALAALENYRQARARVAALSDTLIATNPAIAVTKERAQEANVAALTADLARLQATEARHSAAVSPLCEAYLHEKAAKAHTEALRAQARAALDNYRQNVFPAYEAAINTYLQRFNAGFRLTRVISVNTRAGSAATYAVVINDHEVALSADEGPSFRNTLSAGDRNSLALAFFFACLERDAQLANKIVVIDDPMTSLDENRALATIQEIRRLLGRVTQVIVLSHSKPFLMALWKDSPSNNRMAMRIGRAAAGSEITAWNVNQDSITEHDRRYARVLAYLAAADPNMERTVASDLRPMLEAFI
ncbi:MAG: AAA family ATPase, partial [Candidatus Angelobacter sp.]